MTVDNAVPSAAQIAELGNRLQRNVSSELIDTNGHMNVLYHLDFGSSGADVLMQQIGIDDAYRAQRRLGVFTVEHHLRYHSELLENDGIDVYNRVLDRSSTVVHMMSFVVNRDAERLSSTLEIVLIHVDLGTRRPVAIPADIAAGLDRHISKSSKLGWAAPICGVMGVRR
jgi:acyl-CoA thioester hydrolase